MAKQPFTSAGVRAKQTELNALSAPALKAQADLIRSDLRTWVSDNFTLDTAQQTYLTGIDDRFIELASGLTGYAVENKLTVILSVTGSPTTFKLIHLTTNIEGQYSPSGFSTSGTLTYTITYS